MKTPGAGAWSGWVIEVRCLPCPPLTHEMFVTRVQECFWPTVGEADSVRRRSGHCRVGNEVTFCRRGRADLVGRLKGAYGS